MNYKWYFSDRKEYLNFDKFYHTIWIILVSYDIQELVSMRSGPCLRLELSH